MVWGKPGPGTNSVHRRGESRYKRLLYRTRAPIAHCILCIALSVLLIVALNGRRLKPEERQSYMDIFRGDTNLRASDITTLVSAVLVVLRIVGQSYDGGGLEGRYGAFAI